MNDRFNAKGKLTITRPSYGDGRKLISIMVKDKASRNQFLEVTIPYAEFAAVLTGMGEVECDLELKSLATIGKQKETKSVTLELDHCGARDIPDEVWDKACKGIEVDGWIVSRYLGTKGSVVRCGSKDEPMIVRVNVYRFVEPTED